MNVTENRPMSSASWPASVPVFPSSESASSQERRLLRNHLIAGIAFLSQLFKTQCFAITNGDVVAPLTLSHHRMKKVKRASLPLGGVHVCTGQLSRGFHPGSSCQVPGTMKPLCPYRNSTEWKSFPSLARSFVTPEKGQEVCHFNCYCSLLLHSFWSLGDRRCGGAGGPLNVTQKKAVGRHSGANTT